MWSARARRARAGGAGRRTCSSRTACAARPPRTSGEPVAVRHLHVPTCLARLTHSHSTTACASARRRRTSGEPRARNTCSSLRQVELRTRALNHIRAPQRVLQLPVEARLSIHSRRLTRRRHHVDGQLVFGNLRAASSFA